MSTASSLGCAKADGTGQSGAKSEGAVADNRMVVRSADLVVTVDSPEAAFPNAQQLVKEAGGFVERSTGSHESSVWLACRVPATELDRVMGALANLGTEDRRAVSTDDVTERYADLEARIRNNLALRGRLEELLKRASGVKDVLAIETELSRIQAEIESMQWRFNHLKSEVEMSTLYVTFERKTILGPLGYVGYGVWWVFSKLFVIK